MNKRIYYEITVNNAQRKLDKGESFTVGKNADINLEGEAAHIRRDHLKIDFSQTPVRI